MRHARASPDVRTYPPKRLMTFRTVIITSAGEKREREKSFSPENSHEGMRRFFRIFVCLEKSVFIDEEDPFYTLCKKTSEF